MVTTGSIDWHTRPDLRRRAMRWWHLAFVAVPVATFAVVALFGEAGENLWLVGALLAVIPVGWVAVGHRAFRSAVAGWVFAPILILDLGFLISLDANTAILQALVYPFVWSRWERTRDAVTENVVVALVTFLGFLAYYDRMSGTNGLIPALLIALLSLIFSLVFGTWISRIAEYGQERQRLLDQLTSAQERLAAANRDQGIVAERERMARELHDTLTQSLTGMVMTAERARTTAERNGWTGVEQDLSTLESIARHALGEARALVASTAAVQVDGGLAAAAGRLAERFTRETGVQVDVDVTAEVPRELEVVLLRCAQEALANVRKHARAGRVRLSITGDGQGVELRVEDDGRGIAEPEDLEARGFGIAGMRERVALVGGTIDVGTRPEGGARLVVRVPLEDQELAR